jgi:hypothetical protein
MNLIQRTEGKLAVLKALQPIDISISDIRMILADIIDDLSPTKTPTRRRSKTDTNAGAPTRKGGPLYHQSRISAMTRRLLGQAGQNGIPTEEYHKQVSDYAVKSMKEIVDLNNNIRDQLRLPELYLREPGRSEVAAIIEAEEA